MMLRAALRRRNAEEKRDPTEADLVFVPYWDAAREQKLPDWVVKYQPQGGTAIVQPGFPPGHPAHGKPVGSRYKIKFGRWPGTNPMFAKLQSVEQIQRMIDKPSFDEFYRGADLLPEPVPGNLPAALVAYGKLDRYLDGFDGLKLIVDTVKEPPKTLKQQVALVNALFALGHVAVVEASKNKPNREILDAVAALFSVVRMPPHVMMHLWAGGLDPANKAVRGTVTYFNELGVDPVFWMLHTELDRYWYTWERSHKGRPSLQGEAAIFTPVDANRASWYGGGFLYSLDELAKHDCLPYVYERTFGA